MLILMMVSEMMMGLGGFHCDDVDDSPSVVVIVRMNLTTVPPNVASLGNREKYVMIYYNDVLFLNNLS